MTREEIINEIKCLLSELNNGEDAVSYLTQNDVKWLNENIKALEQEPRWIPVSERLPKEHICDDGWHEPSDYVLVFTKCGCMHVTRWWSRFDERWVDLKYPTTDKVIAWMPLPKQYEPQESEG